MPTLRLALAQVDPTVGDLAGNAALVRGWTRKAAESGAHLVAFPEMMLTGYPVEDLVFRESFVAASQAAVADARRRPGRGRAGRARRRRRLPRRRRSGADQRRGHPRPRARATRSPCCTAAGCAATYFKHHLPNYGVFDEDRYFVPGDTLQVVRLVGGRHRRRADHLRGHVAGGRAVRRRRRGPGRAWS